MANTLGLDGDLDDVELLRAVESAFDVKISNAEAAAIFTVGDLHDLLIAKIAPAVVDRKCASAMAFYRLRRALSAHGIDAGANPSLDLSAQRSIYTKTFVRDLENKSSLHLPKPALSALGFAGVYLLFAAVGGSVLLFIVGIGLKISYWDTDWISSAIGIVFFGGVIAGSVLLWFDRGRLPADCATLGALSNATAARSFGLLVRQGADGSDKRIWLALVDVLSDFAVDIRAQDITRETYFLASQLKTAKTA